MDVIAFVLSSVIPFTIIVKSLAGEAPPKSVPAIVIVSSKA